MGPSYPTASPATIAYRTKPEFDVSACGAEASIAGIIQGELMPQGLAAWTSTTLSLLSREARTILVLAGREGCFQEEHSDENDDAAAG